MVLRYGLNHIKSRLWVWLLHFNTPSTFISYMHFLLLFQVYLQEASANLEVNQLKKINTHFFLIITGKCWAPFAGTDCLPVEWCLQGGGVKPGVPPTILSPFLLLHLCFEQMAAEVVRIFGGTLLNKSSCKLQSGESASRARARTHAHAQPSLFVLLPLGRCIVILHSVLYSRLTD